MKQHIGWGLYFHEDKSRKAVCYSVVLSSLSRISPSSLMLVTTTLFAISYILASEMVAGESMGGCRWDYTEEGLRESALVLVASDPHVRMQVTCLIRYLNRDDGMGGIYC